MRTKHILGVALLTTLFAFAAVAADNPSWNDRFRYDSETREKFTPNELSLDLFGTYTDHNRYGANDDNLGGGIGLNYFLTRYVGIGADSYLEEWRWPYRVNGSLIVRIPIDAIGLAPYAFGGGGRQFHFVPQWTAHAGGGLELRLNPNFGIFADGRVVFPDKTEDYGLIRAGVRLGF